MLKSIGKNIYDTIISDNVSQDNLRTVYSSSNTTKNGNNTIDRPLVDDDFLKKYTDNNEYIRMKNELEKKVQDIAWEIDKTCRTDRELLLRISEYLQKNVKYDYETFEKYTTTGEIVNFKAYEAYGALLEGKAVCEGISRAYALIAQQLGFKCFVVHGVADGIRGEGGHAWNIVEYEKEFYHIDVTFDISMYEAYEKYSYCYFGLDDNEISFNHKWDINTTPVCKCDKLSFYKSNNLYINSETQLETILLREIKKGNKFINVKISDSINFPSEISEYIKDKIFSIYRKTLNNNNAIKISYSWNECTRCFRATIQA